MSSKVVSSNPGAIYWIDIFKIPLGYPDTLIQVLL